MRVVEFSEFQKKLEKKLGYKLDKKQLHEYVKERYPFSVSFTEDGSIYRVDSELINEYSVSFVSFDYYAGLHDRGRTTVQTYKDKSRSTSNLDGRNVIDRCEMYFTETFISERKELLSLSKGFSTEDDQEIIDTLAFLVESEQRSLREILIEALVMGKQSSDSSLEKKVPKLYKRQLKLCIVSEHGFVSECGDWLDEDLFHEVYGSSVNKPGYRREERFIPIKLDKPLS